MKQNVFFKHLPAVDSLISPTEMEGKMSRYRAAPSPVKLPCDVARLRALGSRRSDLSSGAFSFLSDSF